MKLLTFIFVFFFSIQLLGQTQGLRRFSPGQIQYQLVSNEGVTIQCQHQLLDHVPWWRVVCADRSFTVDVWLQTRFVQNGVQQMSLMYHVSEGLASSGQKLVQFNQHFTSFFGDQFENIRGIRSSIDVQNGLANLEILVNPQGF
jgi:hypothetical protein